MMQLLVMLQLMLLSGLTIYAQFSQFSTGIIDQQSYHSTTTNQRITCGLLQIAL
jgi:hypothetical protein